MEPLFVYEFVTKGLEPSEDRTFGGYLSVEVVDKQDEIVIISELMKVLPIWMKRGAPLTDTHSNRIVGQGLSYKKTEFEGHPAVYIIGKVFKDYELDRDVWEKIKSGEYKGLSMGGATKSPRQPVNGPDGRLAYSLKDLEQYEVAICKSPANPLALITDINSVVKSKVKPENQERGVVQCTSVGCYIERPDIVKGDHDFCKPLNGDNCELCGKTKAEHGEFEVERQGDILKTEICKECGKPIDKPEEKDKAEIKGEKPDLPIEKKPENAEEIIEREHEITGEKPSKEEEKIHEQVIEESKKHLAGGTRNNVTNESLGNQDPPTTANNIDEEKKKALHELTRLKISLI